MPSRPQRTLLSLAVQQARPALLGAALLLAGCQATAPLPPEPELETPPAVESIEEKPLTNWGEALREAAQADEEPVDIWQRIREGFGLQQYIGENPRIDQQRIGLLDRTGMISRFSKSSEPYIHYIVEQLEASEVPLELALLPMIESAYDPLAYSHARAAGLWQFIPSTGRHFKLEQNSLYDGRRDITASTAAAISYLQRLHDLFNGDWLLALAAYNAGEGTVSKAIERNARKGLPTDYWNLSLPSETRNYVPRLLALSQIVLSPEAYGVELAEVANQPYFEMLTVPGELDLSRIARLTEVDENELLVLNPAYKQRITLDGSTQLLVPVDKADEIVEKLAESEVQWVEYQVQKNDSLDGIASRYHVTASAIAEINELGEHLRVGQTLRIPKVIAGSNPLYARLQYEGPASSRRTVTYTVKRGDTLGGIASRHKLRTRDLMRMNNLRSTRLKIGQKLKVGTTRATPASKTITYTVRSGDTLGGIASRHKVKVRDLLRWNNLRSSKLKIGQKLKITQSASRTSSASPSSTASSSISYQVRNGDTLGGIAQRHGVKVSDLMRWNSLRSSQLKIGQQLKIAQPAASSASKPVKTGSSYKVRNGDTLGGIAQRHGVKVRDLMRWNNLRSSRLKIGQQLQIQPAGR